MVSWTEPRMFDLPPAPAVTPGMSAGRRRTIRQRESLAAGRHPATGLPLRTEGGFCGSCSHHVVIDRGNRSWHKCEVHRLGTSSSAASDIRVSWPACTRFEAAS